MKYIDVDEANELTIRCKQNRSFDVLINLNRDLTGKTYKLQVDSDPALTFESGNGLTTQGQSVRLVKTPAQMSLPTGCYNYDLVELSGSNADNVFTGWFIVEPSITTL